MRRTTDGRARRALPPILLAAVLAFAPSACGSGDGDEAATTGSTAPAGAPDETAADVAVEAGGLDDPETTDDTERSVAPSAGTGTATVVHDGTTYEFVVLRCVEDLPAVDQTVVAFSAEGVPVDTPQALVDDVQAASIADPNLDITSLLEPVFEFGPVLTVSRLQDGGDLVALFQPPTLIQSSTDFRDPADRFLELTADASSATGTAPTDDGGTIELDLTCP